MSRMRDTETLIARVLTSLIFIAAGITQIFDPKATLHEIRGDHLPLADFFYVVSTAVLLIGALSIVVGWQTRWGAAALLVFIVPATFLFHLRSDQNDLELFLRDLAIAGGLILLLQRGPGAWSLDARAQRRAAGVEVPRPRHVSAAS
jgi:putative oxidoreductase